MKYSPPSATSPARPRLSVPQRLAVGLVAATALEACGPPPPAPTPENCRIVTAADGGVVCSNYQLADHNYCIGPLTGPLSCGDAAACCRVVG